MIESPDGKRGVVFEVADGFWVAHSNELLHDEVEAHTLVLWGFVN